MKLPVVHDPRPMYVLFSWAAADGSFRFALVRDPELGVRRNVFLDAYDHHRATGVDLATVESTLHRLPISSLVEWWIDGPRHLSLPPASVVHRIQRLVAQRKATLYFDDVSKWMTDHEGAHTKPAKA